MADPTNYERLRDTVRLTYGLTSANVPDTTMEDLFTKEVIREYSRLRGRFYAAKITLIVGTDFYPVPANIDFIEAVLWNDSYPEELIVTNESKVPDNNEEYFYLSIKLIRHLRAILATENLDELEQEWTTYQDGATIKIRLYPPPTTDIYVAGRKLFTKDDYPVHDERAIKDLFKAVMLRRIKSTGQYDRLGDLKIDNEGLEQQIEKHRKDFYLRVRPYTIGRR